MGSRAAIDHAKRRTGSGAVQETKQTCGTSQRVRDAAYDVTDYSICFPRQDIVVVYWYTASARCL